MEKVEALRAASAFLETRQRRILAYMPELPWLRRSFPSIGRKFLSLYEPGSREVNEQEEESKNEIEDGRKRTTKMITTTTTTTTMAIATSVTTIVHKKNQET